MAVVRLRWWWLLILIGLIAAIWWWQRPKDTPPEVLTAVVKRADLEDNVLAAGTLEAQKLVSVGAQASGQVTQLSVALGDNVKKGQVIAQIDPLTQQNQLKNAEAALANQQAQKLIREATLNQTRLAWQRQRELLKDQATSQADYDSAEAAYKTAQAELAAINAQIRQAQLSVNTAALNLGYSRVVAPMDGTVVAVVTEEGQTVNANQTTPTIVKLANLNTLTVKAQISEADVVKVKAGLPVYFTILGRPEHRYQAQLRAIEPAPTSIKSESTTSSSSSSAVYYNGLFDVPNPNGELRIDMTAQVYIVLQSAKNALVIPTAALPNSGGSGQQTIQVLDATGYPKPRQVVIGLNNRVQAQVLSGLKEGEKVVLGESSDAEKSSGRAGRPPMRM